MARFRFTIINGSNRGSDPLGGAVERDNASLTMLTTYIAGPMLDDMKVGESQTREANTADGRCFDGWIRYQVERIS